jgi:hypothetical protein
MEEEFICKRCQQKVSHVHFCTPEQEAKTFTCEYCGAKNVNHRHICHKSKDTACPEQQGKEIGEVFDKPHNERFSPDLIKYVRAILFKPRRGFFLGQSLRIGVELPVYLVDDQL